MMLTFKEFIKNNNFVCSLLEQDAAPTAGAAPESPANPQTTNSNHFSFLKRQLGINSKDLDSALEGNSMPIFQVPDYSDKWGFLVGGTCTAIIKKRSDDNYDVTFQLEDKYLMEPESFIKPYKKGDNPIAYQGKIENKTEIVTKDELQDMMAKPFAPAAAAPPAPMGGLM